MRVQEYMQDFLLNSKFSMVVTYLGNHYCGWQKQTSQKQTSQKQTSKINSIQGTIEKALCTVTRQELISLVGSGRTDSGVHASGQVAHFTLRSPSLSFSWDSIKLMKGLNSLLPKDIRILRLTPVSLDFHAQRNAEKKQYSYYFHQGPTALPFFLASTWWVQKTLDLEAMSSAVMDLLGSHEFKPFQASGSKIGMNTIRKIYEIEITREKISFPPYSELESSYNIRLRIVGSGFLKQMVRGIAGTLVKIGLGKFDISTFRKILSTGDRSLLGPTAPARGLWLEKVWYQ